MPRFNSPSSNRNNNKDNGRIPDPMPFKSRSDLYFSLTQSGRNRQSITDEMSQMIQSVNQMKESEIGTILNESYSRNDVEQFNDLIRGLFKGHQNYNDYYLTLKSHSNNNESENEEDEDELQNKENSKKGQLSFMNKSILFFVEWTKLINSNHTDKLHEQWTKRTISIYLDEIGVMPLSYFAHNAYHIVQSVTYSNNTCKSFCLLSDLMISLKHAKKIELNLIDRESLSGREFESLITRSVCSKQWKIEEEDEDNNECSQQMVLNILSCLKDLDLTNEESVDCLAKIMNVIPYVQYSYLPPTIYFLLMLGQKRNMLMILRNIFIFFNHLDDAQTEEENTDLWLEQSQILHHFVYITGQSQTVCSHTIKLLKNRCIRLDAFSFAVLLSIATIRKYKDKIIRFLMSYITQYFEYHQMAKKYQYADIDKDVYYSPIWSILERVLYRSIRGRWELCIPSLVDLGFQALDNGDTWPQNIHFTQLISQRIKDNNRNDKSSQILTQKIHNHLTQHVRGHILRKTEIARNFMDHELTQRECIGFAGCYILKMLFFVQTYISKEIICKLLHRITHFADNSTHCNINSSLHLLQILATKKQSIFLKDAMAKKLESYLEEFPTLPPLIAMGFLHALNPIIELQPILCDKILYILRKMLFSPNSNIRILGVEGFISILQHTKTGAVLSSSQQQQQQSLEIIGYLRRALQQQTVIRERVYFGFYRLFQCDEFEKDLVIDVLLDQLKIYYIGKDAAKEKNILCPLDFNRCFDEHKKERIIEPLPGLLMVCTELLFLYESNGYDFNELYATKKSQFDDDNAAYLSSLPSNIASLFELKLIIDDIVKRLAAQKLRSIQFEKENDEYFEAGEAEELEENVKHIEYCNGVRYLLFECLKACSDYQLKSYIHSKDQLELRNAIGLIKKFREILSNDKKNKFKFSYKGQLNKSYFTLNAYLSVSKILKLESIQNKKEIDLLRTFAIENMCIYLRTASKQLSDLKSAPIKKKKNLSPIIPNIVPYFGAVGCYTDDKGGISKLMQLISAIFGPLLKESLNETRLIADKRKELSDPANSDDDSADNNNDEDDDDKKEKKPLTKLNKREKECELCTECIRNMLDIAMNANNNTLAFELLVTCNPNEDDLNSHDVQKRATKNYQYVLDAISNAHSASLSKLAVLWAAIFYKMTMILKARSNELIKKRFIRAHKEIEKITSRNHESYQNDQMLVSDKGVLKNLVLSHLEILSTESVAEEDVYGTYIAEMARVW